MRAAREFVFTHWPHRRFMVCAAVLILTAAWSAGLFAQQPPAGSDDTLDWLVKQAATQPSAIQPSATQPAATSQPASPFAEKDNSERRPGVITLSSGEKIRGQLFTTREKPIRIWDDAYKEYKDVPMALIQSMEAKVLWERDEREWHFAESGSDIKEYSGKTYPARELQYVVRLVDGQSITGGIVAPLYAAAGDQQQSFVLYKRQKGEVGGALKKLIFISKVEFE